MSISYQTRALAAGFFVGATIFWMSAYFLQKTGYLYIHTRDYSHKLREFNTAMSGAEVDIPEFERFLEGVSKAFEEVRASGKLPGPSGTKGITELLPDFYSSHAGILKKRNATALVVWKDGNYKILIQSEACTAVALLQPEMVDPMRQRYTLFCRFFGRWTPGGRQL